MNSSGGYVKTYRKIVDWEWYSDANTFRLFFHLLVSANYELGHWQGIEIQPGQLITGREKLAKELRLSEREIRTALNKLKSTNEIAIKTTNRFSIITICNWDFYQGGETDVRPTKRPTRRPSSDQQTTTIKEYKEREEIKNDIPTAFEEFFKTYPGTKRGLKTEYWNFKKKNTPEVLPLLMPGLENEIKHHDYLNASKQFNPSWKNLSTWINQHCWEQKFPTTNNMVPQDNRPPRPSQNHAWSELQKDWIVK
jgi:hypothetical protein